MTIRYEAPAVAAVPEEVQVATKKARTNVLAGLAIALGGFGAAYVAHSYVKQVGVLTWSVALGMLAANLQLIPDAGKRALGKMTKRLLRVGIVLLGCSVSFQAISFLGLPTIAVVVTALVSTLVFTTWLGNRVGLGRARALIIGTGFAICGASAIAAMEESAGADEEDVAAGIAMVTLFGTLAMVLLPILMVPLGLTHEQCGIWAGASVQEVGQVVAAASPAGAAVVAIAVVVKLTRVLLLAPVVASVSVVRRLRSSGEVVAGAKRPPIVPLFVLGFVGCAALRSAHVIPHATLAPIANVQTAALGAALFGMGASVNIGSLLRKSGAVVLVASVSTVFIAAVSLAGILLVTKG
jgi:uncharacterized integral membrane protein (TIGR00698 family)